MEYPEIGIRPVIDGRWGGVRESLERQTMAMANSAAKLIGENLHYADGTPVQCVIAGSTIGGGAEVGACAEKLAGGNVTGTLTVTPCWCYGSETMDLAGDTDIPEDVREKIQGQRHGQLGRQPRRVLLRAQGRRLQGMHEFRPAI